MARGRGGKALKNDSIVIVCEGTETEFPYFQEMCKFTNLTWRIVPVLSERVNAEAKAARQAVMRILKDGDPSVYTGPEYYVGLAEVDQATYEQFKSEPTRWVRAAQLYKEREGYYEAWAVYDLDQGRDSAHPEARALAEQVSDLHIAFSAYSFEEWLLLHFERNPKAFSHSECKSEEDVKCGHKDCEAEWNCHGETCIGGRLRECKYISEYEKKDGAKVVAITREKLHEAYVNAVWSRSLSADEVYKCNPYTDVDKLVMRLLHDEYDIKWLKLGEEFENAGSVYKLAIDEEGLLKIQYLRGKAVGVIAADNIYWCNNEYNKIQSACSGVNINLQAGKCEAELCNKPVGAAILCITDRVGQTKREYYFEC